MWAHNQIRTWAGIHSAGSQCSWFGVKTESNGVVTGMTKHLPLLCTITTRHWALQQHTHKQTFIILYQTYTDGTQHVRCMYLWPGAQPPLSRAQVAIAVSAGLWALVTASNGCGWIWTCRRPEVGRSVRSVSEFPSSHKTYCIHPTLQPPS